MPYIFTEIERQKTAVIKALFAFLVIFYFIVMESLWIVTRVFFTPHDRIPVEDTIFIFALALVVAAIHWLISTHNIVAKILDLLSAEEPDPDDSYHQIFKNVVEEVCVATGGFPIRPYIAPTSGLNAFAISDYSGNMVIGITEGLLSKLSRSQIEAVVAHEAGHVISRDSLTTSIACSLFGIQSAICEGIASTLRYARGPVILYIAVLYAVMSLSRFINILVNMFISRQKEYRADSVSVRLTRNPIALAEALHIISRGWRGIGVIPASLSPVFIASPEYNGLEESEGFVSDLFSTHPPMKSRLDILLSMAHSSYRSLEGAGNGRMKVPVEQGMTDASAVNFILSKKEWFVHKDSGWEGPFVLKELFDLPINPASWIARSGDCMVRQASDYKEINELFKKDSAPADTARGFGCPHCKVPLSEIHYEGAPAYRCGYCGGIFVKDDVIPRIMLREYVDIPDQAKKTADLALAEYPRKVKEERERVIKVAYLLQCPKCPGKMRRAFYSYAFPVEVDRCDSCGYVWFDKWEIEMLQYLSEKSRHSL